MTTTIDKKLSDRMGVDVTTAGRIADRVRRLVTDGEPTESILLRLNPPGRRDTRGEFAALQREPDAPLSRSDMAAFGKARAGKAASQSITDLGRMPTRPQPRVSVDAIADALADRLSKVVDQRMDALATVMARIEIPPPAGIIPTTKLNGTTATDSDGRTKHLPAFDDGPGMATVCDDEGWTHIAAEPHTLPSRATQREVMTAMRWNTDGVSVDDVVEAIGTVSRDRLASRLTVLYAGGYVERKRKTGSAAYLYRWRTSLHDRYCGE